MPLAGNLGSNPSAELVEQAISYRLNKTKKNYIKATNEIANELSKLVSYF